MHSGEVQVEKIKIGRSGPNLGFRVTHISLPMTDPRSTIRRNCWAGELRRWQDLARSLVVVFFGFIWICGL